MATDPYGAEEAGHDQVNEERREEMERAMASDAKPLSAEEIEEGWVWANSSTYEHTTARLLATIAAKDAEIERLKEHTVFPYAVLEEETRRQDKRIAELEAETRILREAEEALAHFEWGDDADELCPICRGNRQEGREGGGHYAFCPLLATLTKLRAAREEKT